MVCPTAIKINGVDQPVMSSGPTSIMMEMRGGADASMHTSIKARRFQCEHAKLSRCKALVNASMLPQSKTHTNGNFYQCSIGQRASLIHVTSTNYLTLSTRSFANATRLRISPSIRMRLSTRTKLHGLSSICETIGRAPMRTDCQHAEHWLIQCALAPKLYQRACRQRAPTILVGMQAHGPM
ncbi:hypothetical protein ACLOJK_040973 [Asimina triloba]